MDVQLGPEQISVAIIQKEEIDDIPDFEKELGIVFNEITKADDEIRTETNGILWAKKIFKTKPNHTVSAAFKEKIKTIFHHLTKEELIEKVLANHLAQTNIGHPKAGEAKKKKK